MSNENYVKRDKILLLLFSLNRIHTIEWERKWRERRWNRNWNGDGNEDIEKGGE
jgi:hypothetical protein